MERIPRLLLLTPIPNVAVGISLQFSSSSEFGALAVVDGLDRDAGWPGTLLHQRTYLAA